VLVQSIAKDERIAGVQTPFYLWKWNENSVVRRDNAEDYILDTYSHLIRQKMALVEEFVSRKMVKEAVFVVAKTVIDVYYDCQQSTWRVPEVKQKVHKAENWFAAFLKRYAEFYQKADIKAIAGLAKSCREHTLNKGTFFMEAETLQQFIERIVKTAKPVPKWEQNV
jgi:hypothetical protein